MLNKEIKRVYGTKSAFCKANNHKYKDLASKLRTFNAKIKWANEFIKPLGLVLELKTK